MNASLAALKAMPLWLLMALAAAGFIWWQHGQIQKARAENAELSQQVGQCQQARDSLVALVNEQGKALGDLQLAAQQRQAAAEKAVADARASAQPDYQAANRIQQERTGGDQCTAATSIIDKELGL
ncbi:hypothetical protein [Pseudomonas sp. LP_4_YM]|uniref:hypothetical protein n=1 Tax=Pseudomonas sp. LP_4_YM TaxID=2485135 RepID=UPI0010F03D0D|nr:hypothetical protein [Pseudomonas sp. LP_4_YM]TCT93266.1 hypothetical protein EC913_11682 [Pseudomonas sp. LP_4_YM]